MKKSSDNISEIIFTYRQYDLIYNPKGIDRPSIMDSHHHFKNLRRQRSMCERLNKDIHSQHFFEDKKLQFVRTGTSILGDEILNLLTDRLSLLKNPLLHTESIKLSPILEIINAIADAALSKDGGEVPKVGFIEPLPVSPLDYPILLNEETTPVIAAYNGLVDEMKRAVSLKEIKAAVKNFNRNPTER